VDNHAEDDPHTLVPLPAAALVSSYFELVMVKDQLSKEKFYRLFHTYVKIIAKNEEQLRKENHAFFQQFVKDRKRKPQYEIGRRFSSKGVEVYNGLKMCISSPVAEPAVEIMKYCKEHDIEYPMRITSIQTQKKGKMRQLDPIVATKKQKITAGIFPIIGDKFHVRMRRDDNHNYKVEILKPTGTKFTLEGPDKDECYSVSGTHPEYDKADYNGLPSGEFQFNFRVPTDFDSVMASQLLYEDKDGLVTLTFLPRKTDGAKKLHF